MSQKRSSDRDRGVSLALERRAGSVADTTDAPATAVMRNHSCDSSDVASHALIATVMMLEPVGAGGENARAVLRVDGEELSILRFADNPLPLK